ncbi:unnamed protein product [Rhizophagus irregularis]|uniref:C2H2-type domain-containing protein n=1 Tax=Rhizophagus irregularis TaxID=588596 RepID=A0A915Z4Y2_9GLOM|nr:unnamed protein product [Rhizophagus irregularis]CAB5216166.1 unnamed protein product [Rhizophagus irregularis]CAB5362650.1 unnamed protein product [Rhizophagus irregularis]
MQNQNQTTYLPPIRTLLGSPVEEVCSPFSGSYSPSHTVPSPTYPTVSPQSTDAHHLAAINAHNKLNSNASQHTSIRSLLSPPESPDMKSSGYQNYGTQQRYEYIAAPQQTQQTQQINRSYEEPSCSCCIKPIPVYSAPAPVPSPVPAPVYSQYVQPQPQRYSYAPLSPYDRKPTPPSLPRLNTILESLAPPKHFSHKSFVGQLSPTGSSGNRYQCPYCSKRFSRPSSLRIHTYSHTGEKPFVCTEPGCGRKFSVQSNMRRHLRVHRLGRPVKKTRYDGEEGYKMLNPGMLRSY